MIRKDQFKKPQRFEPKRQSIQVVEEEEQQSIQDISEFNSIVHALQSTSKNARQEAARRLGELGLEDAVEPLSLAFFDEEDASVRIQIIEALSQIGTDEAIAGIMDALDDTDENIRKIAVDALGGIDSDEVSDQVIDELMYTAEEEPSLSVRLAAIEALFKYEDRESSIRMLSELSSDPDPEIQDAIKRGMEQRAKNDKPKPKGLKSKAKGGRKQRTRR